MDTTPQPDPTQQPQPQTPAAAPTPSSATPPATSPNPPANPPVSQLTAASPPVSIVQAPNVMRPAKRGGLAGVMDEIADDIAGTKGSARIYKDSQGNEYIQHPSLSRKQQWIKIAGEALRGAAAGAAVAKGPGGAWRGAEAGIESQDKFQAQQDKNDQAKTKEARQEMQDRFNQVKLKHDMVAKEFELQRLQVKATQDDIKFAQEQTGRMQGMVNDGKAFDLGTYRDEADLARVKQANPNFWKDVHANNIVAVPQVGPDGQRNGIRIFQTTPGIGNQLEPPGTAFKVFVPPAKPGDPPTLQDQIPTEPMTWNQHHAYDLAAMGQMQKWQMDQKAEELKQSEIERNRSEIPRNRAEANKANAEAAKKEGGKPGYIERPDGTVWISNEGEAKQSGLPFEEMKPGDIQKDKQAMRQLNDVQMNASRYTRAASIYANPQATLTYRGKPVSEQNPIHVQGLRDLVGLGKTITNPGEVRANDNAALNTLMNKAGWAELNASISGSGGHIDLPLITAFGESLSREIASKDYNELSDQAKDLYDGYLRTLSAVPAYIKVLTTIGRSNKEILNLELANIKHPGYAPSDILRGQEAFQQNIDKAADGFPRNMVGVPHPSDVRRQIENNGGNPELPDDVKRLLNGMSPAPTGNQ